MMASATAPCTMSQPGSERSSAITAEASRTTLVTLVLGATILVYLIGEQYTGWSEFGEVSLRFSQDLITRLDVQAETVIGDDQRVASGDPVAVAQFGRNQYPRISANNRTRLRRG